MQDRRDQIVILLFTLVQIALIFVLGYTPYPDSEGYLALARESLAQHQLYPIAEALDIGVGAVDAATLACNIKYLHMELLLFGCQKLVEPCRHIHHLA